MTDQGFDQMLIGFIMEEVQHSLRGDRADVLDFFQFFIGCLHQGLHCFKPVGQNFRGLLTDLADA